MKNPRRIRTPQQTKYRIPASQTEWSLTKLQISLFLCTSLRLTTLYFPLTCYADKSYKAYREKQAALHAAWLEKKKARDEKIARGEKVGPLERDPTAEEEVGILSILKFIVIFLVCVSLAGKFFTGSYTWEYKSRWLQLKTYWPVRYELILIRFASCNILFFSSLSEVNFYFLKGILRSIMGRMTDLCTLP